MKCLECGNEYVFICQKHLKKCCGLTISQYREKHPGAELMDQSKKDSCKHVGKENGMFGRKRSEEEKKKISEAIKTAMDNPEVKRKCGSSHRGKKWEEVLGEERAKDLKVFHSDRMSGSKNHYYGEKHSDEIRKKMSDKKKEYFASHEGTFKGKHLSEEAKEKIRAWHKEFWSKKTQKQKTEILNKFIYAGLNSNKRSSKTKIENILAKALDELGLQYRWNEPLLGKNVDFLIDNFVIECFGDYWHCNPEIYDDNYYHKDLKKTAAERRKENEDRLDVFRKEGYHVFVIWEKEFKNGSWKLVLENFLKEYKGKNKNA